MTIWGARAKKGDIVKILGPCKYSSTSGTSFWYHSGGILGLSSRTKASSLLILLDLHAATSFLKSNMKLNK